MGTLIARFCLSSVKVDTFEIGDTFFPFEIDGFIGIPPPESLSFSFDHCVASTRSEKGQDHKHCKVTCKKTARPHNEFTHLEKKHVLRVFCFLKTVGLEDPDQWMIWMMNTMQYLWYVWYDTIWPFFCWTNITCFFGSKISHSFPTTMATPGVMAVLTPLLRAPTAGGPKNKL